MRDVVGAWLSFLCVLHCVLPVLVIFGGVSLGLHHAADEMHEAWLHTLLLFPVIALLAFSIPKAYRIHGNPQPAVLAFFGVVTLIIAVTLGSHMETWLTVLGSFLVISSHLLNRRSLKNGTVSLA